MICKICGSEIHEFIWHEGQNQKGRVLRRFECVLHGPLHYQTLLPLHMIDAEEVESKA